MPKRKGPKSSKDDWRDFLINEPDFLAPSLFEFSEQFKRFRFYLETLEDFISKEETREVAGLEAEALKLSEAARDEFWSIYYPIHYDEIFRSILRSSFLVSVLSFVEISVSKICENVVTIARAPITISDLRGDLWTRASLFLKSFGGFTQPTDEVWNSLKALYDVRNFFVHYAGLVVPKEHRARLSRLTTSLPGFIEKDLGFELDEKFLPGALDTMASFLDSLSGQLNELRQRTLAFEKNKTGD
jgi:hypothetical protein